MWQYSSTRTTSRWDEIHRLVAVNVTNHIASTAEQRLFWSLLVVERMCPEKKDPLGLLLCVRRACGRRTGRDGLLLP